MIQIFMQHGATTSTKANSNGSRRTTTSVFVLSSFSNGHTGTVLLLYKDEDRKRKSARLTFFFANKEIFPIILRNQNLVIAASIAILVYVKFGKRDSRGQVQ